MHHNDFAGWIRKRLDAGSYSDDADAARALGVAPSTVTRWLSVRYPTRATIREVATRFEVPVHEVLVAGGYMTPHEAAATYALYGFSTDELRKELARRSHTCLSTDEA